MAVSYHFQYIRTIKKRFSFEHKQAMQCYSFCYTTGNEKRRYNFSLIAQGIKFHFRYVYVKKEGLFGFRYKQKAWCYSFSYTNGHKEKLYRLSLKAKGIKYHFAYLCKDCVGRHKFRYNRYSEIYHEKPLVSFMYPYHQGFVTGKTIEFMFPSHQLLKGKEIGPFVSMYNKETRFYKNIPLLQQKHRAYSAEKWKQLELLYKREIISNISERELSVENVPISLPIAEIIGELAFKSVLDEPMHFFTEILGKPLAKEEEIILHLPEQSKNIFLIGTAMLAAQDMEILNYRHYVLERLPPKEIMQCQLYLLKVNWLDLAIEKIEKLSAENRFNPFNISTHKSLTKYDMKTAALYYTRILSLEETEFYKDSLTRFFLPEFKEGFSPVLLHYFSKTVKESLNDKWQKPFFKPAKEGLKDTEYKYLLRKLSEASYYKNFHKLSKEDKVSGLEALLKFAEKPMQESVKGWALLDFEILKREIGVYSSYYRFTKDVKNLNNKKILIEATPNKHNIVEYETLFNLLVGNLNKQAFNERIILSLLKSNGIKEINYENIMSLFRGHASFEIFVDTLYWAAIRQLWKGVIAEDERILPDMLSTQAVKDLEHILPDALHKQALKDLIAALKKLPLVGSNFKKGYCPSRKNKELLLFNFTLGSRKRPNILLQNEHEMSLWKRFWFLYGSDLAYDNKILPSIDYPYEDNPIEFEGFEDLMPDNWQQIYPTTFWLKVDCHPIREGADIGNQEIPLAVNIMIDIVNVLILMWGRFYMAFWGWTGTQAVIGLTIEVYRWITLEESIGEQEEKDCKEHYERCYRWLRWEAEKVALTARHDMELRGNYYVGVLLEEMINYMQDHHFDIMPIFEDVNKMDEWRRSFNRDLQNDIRWVLDKVKAIRHKLIIGKEKKGNV